MSKSIWAVSVCVGVCVAMGGCASKTVESADGLIGEQAATDAALAEVGAGGSVIGIRFDAPDTQWDVFVADGERAFEVEVDAVSGAIVAVEEESRAEIEAELAGDLSHEGVAGDVD